MDDREYKNANEFAVDVRLMFTNCYKYNPPEHDVVKMCMKLQEVFEVRFAKMPEEPPPSKDSSDEEDSDESGSEGGDESSSGEDDFESEAKRASQLTYLHEQVCRHALHHYGLAARSL